MSLGFQDRPSKYTTAQHWDRQDARHALSGLFTLHYVISVSRRIACYASTGDYWQAWYAIEYLSSLVSNT